jgi:hypothetical protein
MSTFNFTRLLGNGLDRATEAELEEAAEETRRRIAGGNEAARDFLDQIEDRLTWKRNKREESEGRP